MKKVISLFLSVILAAASFSGCGKSNSGFSPSMNTDESLTIRVNGSWSNFQALEAVAAEWNKIYPNVMIDYTATDNYNNVLSTLVSGDNPPEIVMIDADGYYADKDIIIDSLADLSEIGIDPNVFTDNVISGSTVNEKFCVASWGLLSTGFVVNDTLLENLGLSVPKNHEEFDAVCAELLKNGYTPVQGCYIDVYKNIMNNDMKFRLNTTDNVEEIYEKLYSVEKGCGEIFRPEFDKMFELVASGFIDDNINNTISDIYGASILHFFEGQTPFLAFGSEGFSGMKKRETQSEYYTEHPFEYEFVSLPIAYDEPVLSVSYIQGLSIVKNSHNADWAKEFIRFLCTEEQLSTMAHVKGVPSVVRNGDDSRFAAIESIPQERTVFPLQNDKITIIDETFAYTLEAIAKGDVKDAEEAEQLFESHLGTMVM